MRRQILLFFLWVMTLTAMAQRQVTGSVIESDSQEPLAQASVRLLKTDSSFVAGALTDLQGRFHVKAPAAGKYILQITSVGFKTYAKRVTSADAGTVEDPEGDNNGTENQGSSSQTGGNTQSGGSTNTGGSTIPGEGD